MSNRKRALVDADGILIDFLTPALEIVEELSGVKYAPEDFKTWDIFDTIPQEYKKEFYHRMHRPGFCHSLQPYPGAQDGLMMLQEYMDVYIVTSPIYSSPTWSHERGLCLKEKFGIPHNQHIFTHAKYAVVGDLLIEDNPNNLLKWAEHHPQGMPILWDHPYNREDPPFKGPWMRVNAWHQILKHVELQG